MNLIQWLERQQTQAGLSDLKFAEKLGISDSYWNLLRNGKRRPTLLLMQRAVEAFPDDKDQILSCALVVTDVRDDITAVAS